MFERIIALSVTAQDAGTGMQQVSFPGLFGTGAVNDVSAPYQQSYTLQGSASTAGSFQLVAADKVGNAANSEAFTVSKDSAAPGVSMNVPAQTGLLIPVAWAAQDDLTGVRGADVEYKQGAGGAWVRWLTNTLETSAEFSGSDGQSYTFRVRATDRVGNESAWVESNAAAVHVVTKYYYFGSKRVAMRQGSAVYYLHGDHLGSASLVTDSGGVVVSQSRYLPYGEQRWTSGAKLTDFGFTGQRADGFGLMDFHARYYSSVLGRSFRQIRSFPRPARGCRHGTGMPG